MLKRKLSSLPVSQRELAAYLGISGTLLSMTQTGRHGSRQLSTAASVKKARLLKAYNQTERTQGQAELTRKKLEGSAYQHNQLSKTLLHYTDDAERKASMLKYQLDIMTRNEQQDLHWLNTLAILLENLPKTTEGGKEQIWLHNQQQTVLKRLRKNGQLEQLKLEAKIEIELVKARVYRAGWKKII